MPDPQTFKQVIDSIGYSIMGVIGLFGAWQRMKAATACAPGPPSNDRRGSKKDVAFERLTKVEEEVASLRTRQSEIQQETSGQQNSILKQQAAMFDLLVQQRSVLDKILAKMGGLS